MSFFYDWGGANSAFFYAINGVHHPIYDQVMLLGSYLGKYTMFAIYFPLILGFYLWARRHDREWLRVIVTLGVSYIVMAALVFALKAGFSLPRPFVVLPPGSVHIMDGIIQAEKPMTSFPSGHSAFIMLMAAGLWPILTRGGRMLACLCVAWVALSRIALGVHFPADIVGGLSLSFAILYGVRKAVAKIFS
jgi:membrane-associated phospholipid phosphatase